MNIQDELQEFLITDVNLGDIPHTADDRKHYLDNLKLRKGCAICEYRKCPEALHFHHLGESKAGSVSVLRRTVGKFALKEELSKCIVLCANCHNELHSGFLD